MVSAGYRAEEVFPAGVIIRVGRPLAMLLLAALLAAAQAQGAILTTGSVNPDPTTSTSTTSLYVADQADGTMTISGGSRVDCLTGTIARTSGTVGLVTVSGSVSQWVASFSLYIGFYGDGELRIESGGAVSNDSAIIGNKSASSGKVAVTGNSTWTSSGNLYVGFNGSGELNVSDGGTVRNLQGMLGDKADKTGKAVIDGTGSSWVSTSNLYVGFNGNGDLTISHGAVVHSDKTVVIASSSGKTGIVRFLIGDGGAGKLSADEVINVKDSGVTTLDVTADPSFVFAAGQSFDLLDWGQQMLGAFDAVSLPAMPAGLAWDSSSLYTDGTIWVVPEPCTLGLLVGGSLWVLRRKAA